MFLALGTAAFAQGADNSFSPFALRRQSQQAQREYIAELKQRVTHEPDNAALQLDLGRALYWLALERDASAIDQAEQFFASLTQRQPDNAVALAYHGGLLGFKMGNNLVPPRQIPSVAQQMLRELDRAVALAPAASEAEIEVRELRGYSGYYTPSVLGRDALAVEDFTRINKLLEPLPARVNERARVLLILGDTYRKMGETEQARATWQQLRALVPAGEFASAAELRLKSLEADSTGPRANTKEVVVFFGFLLGVLMFGVLVVLMLRDWWRARRSVALALLVTLAALAWNGTNLLLVTAQALELPGAKRWMIWHEHGGWLLLALAPIPFGLVAAYRFYQATFMDIALKRGVALLLLLAVTLFYSQLVETRLTATLLRVNNPVLQSFFFAGVWLLLLACYAPLRDVVNRLVDRWLFRRRDYARVLTEWHETLPAALDEPVLFDTAITSARAAFAAEPVRFVVSREPLAQRLMPVFDARQADVLLRAQLADAELEALFVSHEIEAALALRVHGEFVGVLTCGPRAYGQPYLSEELALLRTLAAQLSRALENLRLHEARRKHAIAEEELRKLVVQSELKALRAQIDPHFFFNALNSVAALIQHEPRAAEELLEDLAELFRHAFKQKSEFVTLAEELELVETYLKVERVRLGAKLQFKQAVLPETLSVKVPALTIQPLIENAVKHGLARTSRGGVITLSAALRPDGLSVIVADTGAGIAAARLPDVLTHGVGLSNVNERLLRLYGNTARLRLDSREGQGTTVAFTIPLEAAVSQRV